MKTINFRPGPNAEELVGNSTTKPITMVKKFVSYTMKEDGSIWAIPDGNTSIAQPLLNVKDFEKVRDFMSSVGWIEVKDEIVVTHGPRCECGAAKTSNPNLHSAIMPCPLFRKGA